MNTIENTLEREIETWDDPGDYPSGAGGGPLPSYQYVSGISGTIVIQLEDGEYKDVLEFGEGDFGGCILEWINNRPNDIPADLSGAQIKKWRLDSVLYQDSASPKLTLSVDEFDADVPEQEPVSLWPIVWRGGNGDYED